MNSLPWATTSHLDENQFYNRKSEISTISSLVQTTADNNAPKILLTGIRSVGKTVLLKKIKDMFQGEYLTIYVDFSRSEAFQKGNMSAAGLIQHYYNEIIAECQRNSLNTTSKRLKKFFKTNNFKLNKINDANGFPMPIFESNQDLNKLKDFVFDLPQEIYIENKDKIKGVIVLIDEFQIIKELNEYKESFLWLFRSYIQSHNNAAYIISGSMGLHDELISDIAGKQGAFGGRLLTLQITPFAKETTKNYLEEKMPGLSFTEDGFERFYYCTRGLPAYVNMFANLLPLNMALDEEAISSQLKKNIFILTTHLINLWNRLTYKEMNIIISLIDKPILRKDIANKLGITTGSLSKSLNKLQNMGLIEFENKHYSLSEPLLGYWLKMEYEEKGIYPYRMI